MTNIKNVKPAKFWNIYKIVILTCGINAFLYSLFGYIIARKEFYYSGMAFDGVLNFIAWVVLIASVHLLIADRQRRYMAVLTLLLSLLSLFFQFMHGSVAVP